MESSNPKSVIISHGAINSWEYLCSLQFVIKTLSQDFVPENKSTDLTLTGLTGVPSVAISVMSCPSMEIWTPQTVHRPATKRNRNLLPRSTHTSLYGTGGPLCWPAASCHRDKRMPSDTGHYDIETHFKIIGECCFWFVLAKYVSGSAYVHTPVKVT
jgi:hypothetical protein